MRIFPFPVLLKVRGIILSISHMMNVKRSRGTKKTILLLRPTVNP